MSKEGWSCPKCSRVWAPHIAACGPCNQIIASFPQFGTPLVPGPPYKITCGQVMPTAHPPFSPHDHSQWNFNGDDLSYST